MDRERRRHRKFTQSMQGAVSNSFREIHHDFFIRKTHERQGDADDFVKNYT